MSRIRLLTQLLNRSTQIPVIKPNFCVGYRFVANHQRPKRSVTQFDKLNGIRERLRQAEEALPAEQWRSFREEALNSSHQIDEINVDATLLGLCDYDTQLRVAQSYLEFLKSEGITPNYASIGRVLRMYYPAYKRGILTDKDIDDIIQIYKTFRSKHPILDQITCENLISALIITPEWKECLELIDMIKTMSNPSSGTYTTLIQKTFETEADFEIGWKLLSEMCELGKQPRCEIFLQYFETIKTKPETLSNYLEKLFNFFADYNIVTTKLVVENLQRIANDFKFSAKIAKLAKNGQCSNCKQYQPDITITAKDFLELSTSFMDKVLIRKDVFLKSTPEEVEKFTSFMERTGPYDCIIDGLNVAYSTGVKKPPHIYAKTLASVVKYFKDQDRQILVLGREHMQKWPQEPMQYVRNNSNLFLTANLSQDDPFLLYATLKSGPKADFVSKDLMRSHAYLLGRDLKLKFRRWQQEHQYIIITAKDQGRVIVKTPTKHSITAAKVNSTWHIPFKEEYHPLPEDTFEVPERWLCLSINQKL